MGQRELRRRALALSRSIHLKGIAPHPFMKPAYVRNAPQIDKLFAAIGLGVVATLHGEQL
jgi:hypothetical protein